jgi:NAD(P)-dependent dehydrogenase (short-subunit alcohol dehydrogenase family)
MMHSLPDGYRALVVGASGTIGEEFVRLLAADPRCQRVTALHRHSVPAVDMQDEQSIADAVRLLAADAPFHLVIHAVGILHDANLMPEKKLSDLNAANLMKSFSINTVGPALVLRYFTPLLSKDRSCMVFLSAKVGSIGDNKLGGWYAYRASKAALNMLVKTASIELKRTAPHVIVTAMHPGTVNSKLSKPFGGETKGRSATVACREMLQTIDALKPEQSGQFLSYSAELLPW